MTYHCRAILRNRGTAGPCPRDAVVVWVDKDGVRHGYCLEDIRQGHLEAIRNGWLVAESALESAA